MMKKKAKMITLNTNQHTGIFPFALWSSVYWLPKKKKKRLTQPHCPCGFICFLLPSKSFQLFTDFKPDTIRDQHSKDTKASVIKWEWRPPRPPWERLQWEFKLYLVCKGATVWHKPVTSKGDKNVVLEALQQLTWRDGDCCEALNDEPITASFRRYSLGFPWKELLRTPFSRPPGNRCMQMGQEQKQGENNS